MANKASNKFLRLIFFEDPSGNQHYGEAGENWREELIGRTIPLYNIDTPFEESFPAVTATAQVAKILCPLKEVPAIIGIGLNYRKHAEEAGIALPKYPTIFTKFNGALAGPFEDIPIDPVAKDLDYEGELCVVIGRDVKNLQLDDDPLDYVLGYMAGNDVSSRFWQLNPERSSGQHGFAKSFDKFAPVGPVIASMSVVKDPHQLRLRTWVNGELRQETATNDLIFDIRAMIRHLSMGMTLRKGTIIMTGTPSGVAAFMNPPKWLNDEDTVEVEIENIGRIRNKMVFSK